MIIPIANLEERDASIHNMRAAFVAGLAAGMQKELLILSAMDGPVFLDIRDISKHYRSVNGIDAHVIDFTYKVYDLRQDAPKVTYPSSNKLAELAIGDPMAENEFTTLNRYYVQTDQFTRTFRGEVNLVVGRKGTGKTALFAQVRDKIRSDKDNVVVDLKPEGYQLIKLKEEILKYASAGVQTHLLVAFWEYLLLLEIAYKILEKDRERHLRDRGLYDGYISLNDAYKRLKVEGMEGDFSERLVALSDVIVSRYLGAQNYQQERGRLSPNVTALLRTSELRDLKRLIISYLKNKDSTWVLFDNLDKGWSTGGVTSEDTLIVRCLIDAMRKLQREFQREEIIYYSVIFIRDDVYEWLVSNSPDFGKEMRASLDWTDRDLLKSMLLRRLTSGNQIASSRQQEIWSEIFVATVKGTNSLDFLVDYSLMRPRNLLKLFSYCRGIAINMGHDKVDEEDVSKGLSAYSNDILSDADNEIRDVNSKANGLLYKFYRRKSEYTADDLSNILRSHGLHDDEIEKTINMLLYYGFLEVRLEAGETLYIYDVAYDMRKLSVLRERDPDMIYCVNPALHSALDIKCP